MSLQFGLHLFLIIILLLVPSASVMSHLDNFQNYPSSFLGPLRKPANRLSSPLINDDGKVYVCLEKNLLAFESNGTIAWTLPLGYTCNVGIAPVHGGVRTLYLVAEDRVLKISFLKIRTPESAVKVFFGPEPGEIIGISVSTASSCVLINVKNRALFAFRLRGQPLWSAGPVIYQHGYHQGCRKNTTGCYFTSVPVIDQCEASIYVSNNEGELYSLSVRSPHFKWIQDLSLFDKIFTVTPGNNGLLYVTVPARALMLALDVSRGTILWQKTIGPLSTIDYAPVVDSNGWVSIGSLDGFIYSFSPTGDLNKFPKGAAVDLVIQVSPALDCSGYAVYISQTEMEGKISRTIGEYTYIAAMTPRNVVFTMLVPATGSIYWSESYPGPFSSILSKSDLQHFVVDERILLAFITASSIGSPLPCQSTRQKLASSCSQTIPKSVSIYTGNERAILLFLLFESVILIILAAVVRFCCIFWRKKKLQGQDLGKFLEKRRSLRLQKKAFDQTISELERKAAEESLDQELLENLGNIVKEREGIKRKLSTTYSLGRDRSAGTQSKSLLPLYDGKTKSFSFQGSNTESVTIFHTLSDTSSDNDSSREEAGMSFHEDKRSAYKGKAPMEVGSCSDDEIYENDYSSHSESALGSEGFMSPFFMAHGNSEPDIMNIRGEGEVQNSGSRSIRRRTMSSTN